MDLRRFIIMLILMLGLAGCYQNQLPVAVGLETQVATFVAQTLTAVFQPSGRTGQNATPTAPAGGNAAAGVGTITPSLTPTPAANLPLPSATSASIGSGTPSQAATATPTLAATSQAATATSTLTATGQAATATPTLAATSLPTQTPAAPAPTSAPLPTTPLVSGGCTEKAAFYGDVTIPDDTLLQMNSNFTKTWRIQNQGTCTWGKTYLLIFAGGSPLNGPPSRPVPNAAPGDIINVSVDLKTPAQGGTYVSQWEFQRPDGTRFGVNSGGVDLIWAKIRVDWGPGVLPTATPAPVSCAYQRNPSYESQLLVLINNVRASKSKKPLTLQSQLSAAALAHSADMACNNFIDHTGSDGSNWYTRIKAQAYSYSYASENIYVGDPNFGGDANGAFTWWMNSPVHRDNILSDKITQIGIGYAYYVSSQYGGYYTLDFARP